MIDFKLKNEWDYYLVMDEKIIEGELKAKLGIVKNLIVNFGFSNEQAASAAEVSVDFVADVRNDLINESR